MSARQKVLTVIGTRPEAIKLCPVVLELQSRPDEFESLVCVTGQHREMLDQVLRVFDIRPDYDLNIMSPPLTMTRNDVDFVVTTLRKAIELTMDDLRTEGLWNGADA